MPARPAAAPLAAAAVVSCALFWVTPPLLAARGVDPKHLALTDCPARPGCDALVLLEEVQLNNEGGRSRYSQRRLVKVFTQEGIDEYADVELRSSVGDFDLRNLKGRTILPDGSEVPLRQDNVHVKYLRQGKRRIKIKTAKFPGVVPGAIIEHSFDILTEPFQIITSDLWLIQDALPVLKAKYTLKSGRYPLRPVRAGSHPDLIREATPFKGITTFEADNLPALEGEPLGPATWPLRTRIYVGSPAFQASWLSTYAAGVSQAAGAFIDSGQGVAQKVAELISPSDAPIEKVRKIYRFVQEKIGSEESRADRSDASAAKEAENAGDVLARGLGSEYERTLLFLAMVKRAGLEHGLLLLAGRFTSAFNKDVPDESQFDSFAAGVKTSAGWTIYDPAARYCPFGMISAEKEGGAPNGIQVTPHSGSGVTIQGTPAGLIVTASPATGYSVVTVPVSPASRNTLNRDARVTLMDGGGLQVEATERGTGQFDLHVRDLYADLDEAQRRDALLEELRARFPLADLVSAEFQKVDSFEQPAVIKYTAKIPGSADPAEGRIVLTPSIYGAFKANPFTAESRRTPVIFRHTQQAQDVIRLVLPEGYEVEDLPAPAVLKDPPFSFAFTYALDEGTLVVSRRVDIETSHWPAADYARLKTFFDKLHEADRQAVVLVKQG